MKNLILLTLTIALTCNAQEQISLSKADYEILNLFLASEKSKAYLNSTYISQNHIDKFISNVNDMRRLYKTADSICKYDKDSLRLEIFCPLADSLKFNLKLVPVNEELNQIKNDAVFNKNKKAVLDFKRIKHKNILENKSNHKNHTVINLLGIHYTKERKLALLVYSIGYGNHDELKYELYKMNEEKNKWEMIFQ